MDVLGVRIVEPRIWTVLCPWVGVRRLPQHFAQSLAFPTSRDKSDMLDLWNRFATGI